MLSQERRDGEVVGRRVGDTDGVGTVQRIAVATDRSDGGDRALRWAIDLAQRSGSALAVIQVLGTCTDSELRVAREALGAQVGDGHEVIVVSAADVAQTLVETAAGFGADLLVVGNSGMRGRKEFLLGNVANRVTHLARCSVLVVNSSNGAGTDATAGMATSGVGVTGRGLEILSVLRDTVIEWRRSSRRGRDGSEDAGPVLLRTSLERLGPTFCKLGQMLSTRPDLVPPEYIAELEKLQSDVPPMTEAEVVSIMEAELCVPWEDVFATIEPEPLAAGTIGQVHRATLADGAAVVVKVQRGGIAAVIDEDLALLDSVGRTLGRSRRIATVVDLPAVFGELGRSLRRELDFGTEADNLERMAGILEPFPQLGVPRCHRELTTPRLLVMDEVPGVPIREAPRNEASDEAGRELLRSFLAQFLEHGFFHADPHPGNLLWHDKAIWLIDLGMVGELDEEARGRLVLLMLAISRQEIEMIVELTTGDLSANVSAEDLDAYTAGLGEILAEMHGQSLAALDLAEFLDRLTVLSMRHGVALPAELMMVGKAIGQVQLTVAELCPDVDPVAEAGRFVMRSITGRVTRRLDPQQVLFEVERMHLRIRQLAEVLGTVSGASPGRQLEIGFRSAPVEQSIRSAGRTVGLGMASGLAFIAASSAPDRRRRPLNAVAASLTGAFVFEVLRQRRELGPGRRRGAGGGRPSEATTRDLSGTANQRGASR